MDMRNIYGTPHTGRQRVLLGFEPDDSQMDLLFELADEWGWELLDHGLLGGSIPADLELSGALIKSLPDSPLAEELRERGCPTVRLGRLTHRLDHELPAVLPDQVAAGRLAAEHFAERRYKDLGIVSSRASSAGEDFHILWTAFLERAKELGARAHYHDYWVPADVSRSKEARYERRTEALAAWLAEIPKPVGILVISDWVALRVRSMCMKAGVSIPDDVALLGVGNSRYCRLSTMHLSSIDMADLAQTREAMQLLRRLMQGEEAPTSPIMVPAARIVERQSTDVLAIADPMVARAVRFMWEHIRENPSVDDVADAVGISRRKLERGFSSALGCGVKAEIMRRRLQVFCRLLRSSDESIANLCARMGYRSLKAMHRQFRLEMGTSPGAYRRAQRGGGS